MQGLTGTGKQYGYHSEAGSSGCSCVQILMLRGLQNGISLQHEPTVVCCCTQGGLGPFPASLEAIMLGSVKEGVDCKERGSPL